MGMAPFGRILVVSATLPLVKLMGDNQSGWIRAMALWCVIALALLLFCFARCKETVVIPAREHRLERASGQLHVTRISGHVWLSGCA